MGAPAPDAGTCGVASRTHTRAHTHTHVNRNAADKRLSVSDPQTHASSSKHTHTHIRAPASLAHRVCAKRAGKRSPGMCVLASKCVCPWLCACAVAAHACE